MSTVFQVQRRQSLPVSHAQLTTGDRGIRRRLSSISLNLKIRPSSSTSEWASRRSKSISAAGSCIRKWWGWGWGWILSRKPSFAADLEMNEEEIAAIGSHGKGSWRHVIHNVTSQIRRKVIGSDNVGLPQTFRYDSLNYAKNFDDRGRLH